MSKKSKLGWPGLEHQIAVSVYRYHRSTAPQVHRRYPQSSSRTLLAAGRTENLLQSCGQGSWRGKLKRVVCRRRGLGVCPVTHLHLHGQILGVKDAEYSTKCCLILSP